MQPRSRGRFPEWTRWVAVLLLVALVGSLGLGLLVRDDDGDEAGGSSSIPTTTINSGGIEVAAPEGWTPIPVATLGFGLAIPPGWEATVLSQQALESLAGASPAVPGFVDSAHSAAEAGAVFYAAGQDGRGRVSDLKIRADLQTGVTDAAGLEGYARRLAADARLPDPSIAVVEDTARPTVRVRYRVAGDTSAGGSDVAVEGTETFVLGPNGIVWSVIVTSEDPATHDDLASTISGSLSFPEP